MPEITFREFTGINNVEDDHRLATTEFSTALDVDLDDKKQVKMRRGMAQKVAGACHSLVQGKDSILFRTGDYLKRLDADYRVRTIASGFGNRAVAGRRVADFVYLSDGLDTYRLDGDNLSQAGIDGPVVQPNATSTGSGALPAGDYQFACTFASADGRESPTRVAGRVTASGGIQFSGVPVSSDSQVTETRIYLTYPNGEDLFLALRLAPGATTALYAGGPRGMQLETQFMMPTPPGSILHWYKGRLLIVYDRWLFFTPPYRYDVVDKNDFFAFPAEITMVAGVNDGLWVGTTEEIGFIGGDLDTGPYDRKLDYGAIKNTVAYRDGKNLAAFVATPRGICLLQGNATVENLTENTYHPAGSKGAAVFRRGNYNQFLVNLQ